METAIILKNLRLVFRDVDGEDTTVPSHPLDQDDLRKLMYIIKYQGLKNNQYDDQVYDLAEDLALDHGLMELREVQVEKGSFWMIEFDLEVDGLIGVSWEDL